MKYLQVLGLLIIGPLTIFAQTNMLSTNPVAEQVMLGNYNPSLYAAPVKIESRRAIVDAINAGVSKDSLLSYIVKLGSFYNRNSGSDTVSSYKGIGAARRWVYGRFRDFGQRNNNRLIPSYLQFDRDICSMKQHRNMFAVLPGTDTTDKSIFLIQGHIDSRCEGLCDTACLARGIEDNATGTALVLELARVMSTFSLKHTVVFMIPIAEEQGLYGADAFAKYTKAKGIKIRAVLNNDVIGGIFCGKTASPPTDCKSEGDVDSLNMRIFSQGNFTSPHKAFARYSQLEYNEEVKPNAAVKMKINVMAPEDRTNRGGDHQAFRAQGYTAVRYTAAHEHGDANPISTYSDRQHSFRDTLGEDTNNDGVIDSFYISFSYLHRNTVINGVTLGMAAISPATPSFTVDNDSAGIRINVQDPDNYKKYKVSVRRSANDYNLDLLYTFQNSLSYSLPDVRKDSTYYISIASIDGDELESIFTIEQKVTAKATFVNGVEELYPGTGVRFLPLFPNPSNGNLVVSIEVGAVLPANASLILSDVNGRMAAQIALPIMRSGLNEIQWQLDKSIAAGSYTCSLMADGSFVSSQKLVLK